MGGITKYVYIMELLVHPRPSTAGEEHRNHLQYICLLRWGKQTVRCGKPTRNAVCIFHTGFHRFTLGFPHFFCVSPLRNKPWPVGTLLAPMSRSYRVSFNQLSISESYILKKKKHHFTNHFILILFNPTITLPYSIVSPWYDRNLAMNIVGWPGCPWTILSLT